MNMADLIKRASLLAFSIGLTPVALKTGTTGTLAASLESLPTGQYYYVNSNAGSDAGSNADAEPAERRRQAYVLLRKAGTTVIGVDGRSQTPTCFRGFIEGDRIIDATRVFPPYQPDSRWDTQEELVNLSQYQAIEQPPSPEQAETLQTCIQFFWR